MAPIGTLWGVAHQRQSKVILSVAAVNELELELEPEWSFTNKPPEFAAKFPYGKIPAFEDADGFKLTEGIVIARHLSSIGTKVNLLGSTPREVAIIDQWVHFAELEIGTPVGDVLGSVYGYLNPFDLEFIDRSIKRLDRSLKHVESHLAAQPSGYVALGTLTLADFMLASTVFFASIIALGAAERAMYPHVFAHYEKVTGDERVARYWGTVGFLDVRPTRPKNFLQNPLGK